MARRKRTVQGEEGRAAGSAGLVEQQGAIKSGPEQAAELSRRMIEEVLDRPAQIALATKVVKAIEDGLEAMTIKGPQSTSVADNMARMRAAELGVEVLGLGPDRKASKDGAAPMFVVHEAQFLVHPPSTQAAPRPVQARVIPNEPEDT